MTSGPSPRARGRPDRASKRCPAKVSQRPTNEIPAQAEPGEKREDGIARTVLMPTTLAAVTVLASVAVHLRGRVGHAQMGVVKAQRRLYPHTHLREEDKEILRASPFFG
jgi:hypothetical protein